MGQIKVQTTTIRKKAPSKPQKKIEVRKVVINKQIKRFNKDAAEKKQNASNGLKKGQ